jgi:hypothetical protein
MIITRGTSAAMVTSQTALERQELEIAADRSPLLAVCFNIQSLVFERLHVQIDFEGASTIST